MAREILGHINCVHCGYENGMRITLDKSGAPFGYCEANCNGQLRVGGNAARVKAFYARHPHLKQPEDAAPVQDAPQPAPVQEKPKPKPEKKPAAPVKVEEKEAPKKAPSVTTLIGQLMGAGK